jgi:hypothetical protein
MSIRYAVLPVASHPDLVGWLKQYNIDVPSLPDDNRYPSPQEIKTTLDELAGYQITYDIDSQHWCANIVSDESPKRKWAKLCIADFNGDEQSPHDFWFDQGDPGVNLLILKRLSTICGPLILSAGANAVPILITADTDIAKVLEEWYERQLASWR